MDEFTPRPQNPRRRRKTKLEIFKEAYLPTIILILTVVLIIIFVAGSLIRRSAQEDIPSSSSSTQQEDPYKEEALALLAQAEQLAAVHDYQGAADLLSTFSGDISLYPALSAKLAEYRTEAANMVTWSDPTQVKILSFHTLIADPARAFTNAAFGTSYNRNFVTTAEFAQILNELYNNKYILVSLSDFTEIVENDDGSFTAKSKELTLPLGVKPLVLVQTNANYYTYMVDSDGDGLADKNGAGFASKLLLNESGNFVNEMVAADGTVQQGNFDLIPILEQFIAEHPDFSHNGARAVIAPSGYDGIFGYRIDAATKDEKGEAFYQNEIESAKAVVSALRDKGYELACYTYSNSAYGAISSVEIQNDLRAWATEITPVFGSTDILVYAQNSEISEYTGSKFNVLQNAGFRYYLGVDAAMANVGSNYIVLSRISVTGSAMAHKPSLFTGMFSASSILNPNRGSVPN